MQTSERGKAFIAAHEGVVLRAYRDVAGVWTIGVGHTARAGGIRPRAGLTISRKEAMTLLEQDLRRFERRVEATRAFKAPAAFDGAVSFDFNTGRIHNATWVRRYVNGQLKGAESALMQWVKAGGRTWPGLKRRRAAEADLVFRGRYGELRASATGADGRDDPGAQAEVSALQHQLRTLKFYRGAVDGISGPRTVAAIRAFQKAHPQLSQDGIAGPATRAALSRALKARKARLQTAGGALCSGGAAGLLASTDAVLPGGGSLWPVVLTGAVLVAVAVGGLIAWRYRDEWRALTARL
ncbi:peptidoglycan-binding protein [Breoghania sp.]|uniref:glycoside hydrolase family protein n=1 Tax=Breoghania sp. TaxID=2065378 RepID=UPI002AA6989E|nr:peptidoglycan-binding protein [Breoghania sp.]